MKNCFRVYIALLTTAFFLFTAPSLFAQGSGTALQFDGASYIQLPKISLWDVRQSSFTITAWFKTGTLGYQNIVRYDGPTSGALYLMRVNTGGQIEFLIAATNRDAVALATPYSYSDGQWHHVAAVRDSSNDMMYIFIDGNLAASTSGEGIKNVVGSSDANMAFGATSWGVELFVGCIDEVSLWNVARTQTEIRETMFHQLTGSETGLIGNWRFDEGTGTTVSDISSNHNTGALINGPLWVPSTPSGAGTSGDPYLIATLDNLYWIAENATRWDKVYKQTADIDATTSSSWDGGAGFSPIGNGSTVFTGSYDGQTYKITGLFISRGTTDFIGLFGYASGATITNVKLDNVQITGADYVGGLIGHLYNSSTATNCYSNGSVTGAGYVGGLIGLQQSSSTASTCYSSGSVTGSGLRVGGLIGYQYVSSTATNCYSSGSVTGGSYVGGLIGLQEASSTDNNCYSSGSVTGADHVGGMIGLQSSSSANNCFWDMTSSGQTSSSGGTGKSTAQMKTASTFTGAGWSGTVWFMDVGVNKGYPYLSWQNPTGTPLSSARATYFGNALRFDGSPQYASLGSPVTTIIDNLTMEAWVKWTGSTTQLQPIFFNGGADDYGYGLILYSNDNISILLGNVSWGVSDSVLHPGVWTHLAMVRNGGHWSLYLNGSSIAMSDLTNQAPITPSTDFYIGAANHPNSYFNGAIDEVRISNVVRYASNFTPPSAPFTTDANTIALYHFDEGTGTTTADASGNGNTLTLVNGPTWDINTLPIELTSFTATASKSGATLNWKTATEVNNYGFEVQRRVVSSRQALTSSWEKIGFVQGNSTSNAPHEYSFTDPKLSSGSFAYRLKQLDNNGAFKYSQETEVTIEAPKVFALSQNYPNPFNPSTMISFDLPTKSFVSLKIFDLLGREVATIVSEEMSTGSHVKQWNAENCPSGVYFYRLQAGSLTETKRMILMK
jgi:hypothetical protein